jgi:hypothetical protein
MLVYEGNYCLPRAVPERMAAVAPSLGIGDVGQRGLCGSTILALPEVGYEAASCRQNFRQFS